MPTYSNANIIKPRSWEEFEEIVVWLRRTLTRNLHRIPTL